MDKVVPINEEYIFEGSMIISQTDLEGNIVFVNRKFCEVSGYKVDELIGQNHNIVRHPDMPHALYAKMWETIKDGQAWNGLIKNIRPDGLYYWVDAEIIPVRNENEDLIGFISVKKVASKKDIDVNKKLYEKLLETQN